MTGNTDRRQIIEAVVIPFAARRIAAMMDFEFVGGIAEPAAVAVACKGLHTQLAPLLGSNVAAIGVSYIRSSHTRLTLSIVVRAGSGVSSAVSARLISQ